MRQPFIDVAGKFIDLISRKKLLKGIN